MKHLLPLAALILLCAAPLHSRAQDPDAFKLEAAIPREDHQLPRVHWIEKDAPDTPNFHVTLRNISSKPQAISVDSFPDIDITDAAGHKWTAHSSYTPDPGFGDYRGYAHNRTLRPGETVVFDIYLVRKYPRSQPVSLAHECSYFLFTPAAGTKAPFPSGKVTLWVRCPLSLADIVMPSGCVTARPVTCVID